MSERLGGISSLEGKVRETRELKEKYMSDVERNITVLEPATTQEGTCGNGLEDLTENSDKYGTYEFGVDPTAVCREVEASIAPDADLALRKICLGRYYLYRQLAKIEASEVDKEDFHRLIVERAFTDIANINSPERALMLIQAGKSPHCSIMEMPTPMSMLDAHLLLTGGSVCRYRRRSLSEFSIPTPIPIKRIP